MQTPDLFNHKNCKTKIEDGEFIAICFSGKEDRDRWLKINKNNKYIFISKDYPNGSYYVYTDASVLIF